MITLYARPIILSDAKHLLSEIRISGVDMFAPFAPDHGCDGYRREECGRRNGVPGLACPLQPRHENRL